MESIDFDHTSADEMLICGLEVARQLSDAHRPLYLRDILLQWDADASVDSPYVHFKMSHFMKPFISRGALREGNNGQFFLPRRRSRLCPYHKTDCLPTRETSGHRDLALEHWCDGDSSEPLPTFLVDLLDPWSRGWEAPVKSKRQQNPITDTLRFHVMRRDGFRCQLCGARVQDSDEVRLTIDHKRSVAMGGSNDPENLWTLCATCNSGKGAQSV